jgi:hypothetical protein
LQLKKLSLDPDIDPEQVEAAKKLNMLKKKHETAELEVDLGTIAEREKLERKNLSNTELEYQVAGKKYQEYLSPGANMDMVTVKDGRVSFNSGKLGIKQTLDINKARIDLLEKLDEASDTVRPVIIKQLRDLEALSGNAPQKQEAAAAPDNERESAADILRKNGKPVTEANINYVIGQLRKSN